MTPNHRKLLQLCIETGIEAGWHKAHKHADRPSQDQIQRCIDEAIWAEIDQWFDWQADVQ